MDSRLGYSLDNMRVITVSENTIKGNRERANFHIRKALVKKGVPPEFWPDHLKEQEGQQGEIDQPFRPLT